MYLKLYILVVSALCITTEANPSPSPHHPPESYHYFYHPAMIGELRQMMGEMSSCLQSNTQPLMDKLHPVYKDYAMELGHDVLESYLKYMLGIAYSSRSRDAPDYSISAEDLPFRYHRSEH